MSSYADDTDTNHAGDWVRCDVFGCTTPEARMERAADGFTLHAPMGWSAVHHQVRDGSTIRTLSAHACPRCVRQAFAVTPTVSARFIPR